jgi:hypothetical protein
MCVPTPPRFRSCLKVLTANMAHVLRLQGGMPIPLIDERVTPTRRSVRGR